MITKGSIMLIIGVIGIITTITISLIINKNINVKLRELVNSRISSGQPINNIEDKIEKYIERKNIVDKSLNNFSLDYIDKETEYLYDKSTVFQDDESTVIEYESTVLIEDESTTII